MWDPIFYWALAALAVPLGAAFVIAVVPPLRRRGTPAAWLSIAAAAFSFGAAIRLFVGQVEDPRLLGLLKQPWLPDGQHVLVNVGLRIDGISVPMLLVLTTVALCVQVFSLGYMAEEPAPARGRYFAYHSLFIFGAEQK
jgi:NADH-quinone oxidoreductase subunit L